MDYNIEFTKGILFIRLFGVLDNNSIKDVKEDIIDVIKEGGIRNLVINIEDLDIKEETDFFSTCDNIINDNKGKMLICGSYLEKYKYVDDELTALKEFSKC